MKQRSPRKVEIRTASMEDAAPLAELSTQLGYPTPVRHSAARLESILRSREHRVLVACTPGTGVVGWAHVYLALRIESDPFAEIGGFVVDEHHRRRGIGRALLAAAETWVRARGVSRLRVRSRSTRGAAHAFYERLGFSRTKEQYVFDKDLAPGG